MALKFNGTSTDFGMRWYNTETGEPISKPYEDKYITEIEFSRGVLKTKPRHLVIHPDHKPDECGFWFNGYQADANNRITFATGVKDKFVISKNEIDFMFSATNQSFWSCYRLQNGTRNDLIAMAKCPGIYVVYTTQEDATYKHGGKEYTHPKMSGRAFLYESEDGKHHTCGRPYGKVGFEIRDLLSRWLPNGLSIGWKLSDEQNKLSYFEKDNFDDGITIHDRWDCVFNTDELYYRDGLPLKLDGVLVNAKEKKKSKEMLEALKIRLKI